MNMKEVPVTCQNEHKVVGHIRLKPGEYRMTAANFIASFVPVDQGHRLSRVAQRDGQFARCICGSVLCIAPDEVEYATKDTRRQKDGRTLTREQARAMAVQLAQSTGPVHKIIENRDEGGAQPIVLSKTRIRVS